MLNTYIKIFKCLSKKNRFSFLLLTVCNVITGFLEILGLGMLIPFLGKILNYNSDFDVFNNKYIEFIPKLSLLEISYILILIFFIKNIFLSIVSYISFILEKNLQVDFTKNLANGYFKEFINGNRLQPLPTIIRNTTVEIKFFQQMASASFFIIQDIIYILIISAFLSQIVDYRLFFSIFLVIFFIFIYYTFSKKIVLHWGNKRIENTKKFLKNILDIFNLIKENFIFGRILFFRKAFLHNLNLGKTYDLKNKMILFLIKPFFEMLMVLCLVFFIFISQKENDLQLSFIIIAVTFGSLYKISPYIIRISTSINTLNFKKSTLDKLFFYLNKNNYFKITQNKNIKIKDINLKNIYYSPDGNKKILTNFNLFIKRNDKIVIIGKSGIGKSTLVDILIGFKKPQQGSVLINNQPTISEDIFNNFSYVPQRPHILNNTLTENITLFQKKPNKIKIKKIISICDLLSLDKRYLSNSLNLGDAGQKISEGQKQKIGIARALYYDREVYIFDEPTSNLDNQSEQKIIKNILKFLNKKIVIFITHNKNNFKFFDKVVVLR
jgi:ABC-type transport system involved in cytochrome bd biosynthesis fused ATPase/permease subunit